MNYSGSQYIHTELTQDIIRIYYFVYNKLGYGFRENVYKKAMRIELMKNGYNAELEKKINVYYDGEIVGEYFADIVVNDLIILELKAVECLIDDHTNQLINYLRATKYEVGLVLNFGAKAEIRRRVFSNDKKIGFLSNS